MVKLLTENKLASIRASLVNNHYIMYKYMYSHFVPNLTPNTITLSHSNKLGHSYGYDMQLDWVLHWNLAIQLYVLYILSHVYYVL